MRTSIKQIDQSYNKIDHIDEDIQEQDPGDIRKRSERDRMIGNKQDVYCKAPDSSDRKEIKQNRSRADAVFYA